MGLHLTRGRVAASGRSSERRIFLCNAQTWPKRQVPHCRTQPRLRWEHNHLGRKHQEMDAAIPPKIAILQQVVKQSENLCFFLAQIALSEV